MRKSFNKLIAILKYLEVPLEDPSSFRNFDSRFKIQKLAFLSKSLGIDLYHKFTIYIKGPYSSALASDYYQFPNSIIDLETSYALTQDEILILDKIRENVLYHDVANEYLDELLETVTTVLYFNKKDSEVLDDEIFARIKVIKPYLKEWMITIAINIAKKLLFKPEYMTEEIKKENELWDKIV